MPIARKPRPAPAATDEAAVHQLINRGGSVAGVSGEQEEDEQLVSVLLRIPSAMLARIDAKVKRRRPVRISRQAWIIDALQSRLSQEEDGCLR